MKDIFVETNLGTVEPFVNNEIPVCYRCGIVLTKENKPARQGVIGDTNKTQGICKGCETEHEKNC